MQKIVFVAHCVLNTASKVVMYTQEDMAAEEALRRMLMTRIIDQGVQVIQLPCPEFTLYGSQRWGHVSNQFDNPFFRDHCKKILAPIILQMQEYLKHEDRFEVLGFIGIDGSPSCGVDYTCTGDWYGSFEGRDDLSDALSSCRLSKGPGIYVQVLQELLQEAGIADRISLTGLFAPEEDKCLNVIG